MVDEQDRHGTILVVDDVPDNIDVLRGVLSAEFAVKVATSGEKALTVAESALPDLILLDIMMPGMDGYEVCSRLKQAEATRDIPVIFVTALTEAVDEEKGFQVGCVDYLTKPVSPPIALARVKTHIALRRAQQELREWNSNLKGRVKGLSSVVTEKVQALASVDIVAHRDRENWLNLLVRLLDMLDPDLQGHASRVAALSVEVAKRVKCSSSEVETIRLAALLHDIGKIGLPTEIISAVPDMLPDPMKKTYHTHPVRGQFLLSPIEWMHDAARLIRHHHEQVNGGGAPDRLIADEIPRGARIIAIADYLDHAIYHEQHSITLHNALRNMRNLAGRNFDKELILHCEEAIGAFFDQKQIIRETGQLLPVNELTIGMIMGEPLYSTSRILLIDQGETISLEHLQRIERAMEIDPPAAAAVLLRKT